MNRFTQYSVEQSGTPKGWLLISRRAGNDAQGKPKFDSRKIRPILLGVPGAKGLPGLNGEAGNLGPKGPQGSMGASGAQGSAGGPGPNGADGAYPEELILWDSAAFESWEGYADGASVVGLNGGLGYITPWAGNNATIVTRTNRDGTTEKRLAIAQGYIARRFPWGSNWNAIEIVFTGRLDRAGTASFGTTESDLGRGYYVGACSGTVNTAYSFACENFYGTSGQQLNLWQFFSEIQNDVYFQASGRTPVGRIGNVDVGVGTVGSSFPAFAVNEGFRSIFTVRIERTAFLGNGNATYTTYLGNGLTTPGEFDYPKQTLMESFAQRSNMAENLPGGLAPETGTQTWNESTGQLDCLNLTWPWLDPLEISAIAVRRIY